MTLLVVRCANSALTLFDGFDAAIAEAASAHGVNEELIRAVIQTESEFDPQARSAQGACGLMQLMPVTARRFGVLDCFDGRQNILAGTRYLKVLLTRYQGSVALSVAAYNAGEGAVARHGGIPPYRQTRAYVRRIQALLNRLERPS
jgi:soluble lytic murein transglycosylase-like protein